MIISPPVSLNPSRYAVNLGCADCGGSCGCSGGMGEAGCNPLPPMLAGAALMFVLPPFLAGLFAGMRQELRARR